MRIRFFMLLILILLTACGTAASQPQAGAGETVVTVFRAPT